MNTKARIAEAIEQNQAEFIEISSFIAANPELGHEEFLASERLIQCLQNHGFTIQSPVLELPTAFLGTYDTGKPGPTVAFLCEYDALPQLGHACGHHLICMMSIGAAVGLKAVMDEIGGIIRVYGTPAEETAGAKVPMTRAGLFDDCDIAMMVHPFYQYEQSGTSLAMDAIKVEYFGEAAHAAASPYKGINALDAVIQLFNGVNAMRQQVRSDARIHGIITNGGQAPNIIPDYAAAEFYVRSADRPYTDELKGRFQAIAEGAALQTGCTVKVHEDPCAYDELRTNEVLSQLFNNNLIQSGIQPDEIKIGKDHGSLDLGNVSTRVPTIHPYIPITHEAYDLHTIPFRDAAQQPYAYEQMIFASKMMAYTAYDAVSDAEQLARIKASFTMQ
ncbi:M20 family metallopeptidase [Paenibacillus sp. SC116]|uniref:M20 family metallopeptidase n=1 Tax=Paenibacillus sp. SC116 TaxID=2968986 RepID=UPI00215AC890|nr:M20 family metallopeptidase [Paenibacillus sp. SC116]MCR8842764.1 M20 family metallopeptidase [Paenibacillus sp. SC116]